MGDLLKQFVNYQPMSGNDIVDKAKQSFVDFVRKKLNELSTNHKTTDRVWTFSITSAFMDKQVIISQFLNAEGVDYHWERLGDGAKTVSVDIESVYRALDNQAVAETKTNVCVLVEKYLETDDSEVIAVFSKRPKHTSVLKIALWAHDDNLYSRLNSDYDLDDLFVSTAPNDRITDGTMMKSLEFQEVPFFDTTVKGGIW